MVRVARIRVLVINTSQGGWEDLVKIIVLQKKKFLQAKVAVELVYDYLTLILIC